MRKFIFRLAWILLIFTVVAAHGAVFAKDAELAKGTVPQEVTGVVNISSVENERKLSTLSI